MRPLTALGAESHMEADMPDEAGALFLLLAYAGIILLGLHWMTTRHVSETWGGTR